MRTFVSWRNATHGREKESPESCSYHVAKRVLQENIYIYIHTYTYLVILIYKYVYIYIYSDSDINIYIYMLHKTFCAKYLSDLFAVAHRNHGRHSTTGTHVMWCQSFRIAKILGVKDLIVISISKISNYYQLFGKSKNCKTSITVLFFRSNY